MAGGGELEIKFKTFVYCIVRHLVLNMNEFRHEYEQVEYELGTWTYNQYVLKAERNISY